jgi:hypothetical protein
MICTGMTYWPLETITLSDGTTISVLVTPAAALLCPATTEPEPAPDPEADG